MPIPVPEAVDEAGALAAHVAALLERRWESGAGEERELVTAGSAP